MMNEKLEGLPESVREAFDEIDDCMRMDIKVVPVGALNVVRAELIRLARENAELREALNHVNDNTHRMKMAESALAELRAKVENAPVYSIPATKPATEEGWLQVIASCKNLNDMRGQRVRLLLDGKEG